MENLLPLIIQLISGAVGGNLGGAILKNLSLGTVGNSLAGILGGGIGGQLLSMLGITAGADSGAMDMGAILASIGSGAAGGGVLMASIGIIRKLLGK